jgi:carbon-monoxide dehydrogenase medium subunit
LKAPPFAYAKPRSLAEAFDLLERPGAKILAGGQSLIPSLNMRLSAPELLVDITAIKGLSRIEVEGGMRDGVVRIGALCTQAELERSAELREHLPLVAEAVAHIAHPAIRNRGTLGGSLALADPAAELPACALALDAMLIVSARKGERRVKAADFFKGLFETDLKRGEVLVGAEFPKADKSVFLELTRRQGDYAIVGLAGVTKSSQKRIAFFGVGATAVLAKHASGSKNISEAKAALAKDLAPTADLYHSSSTKLHLAKVLLERAWNRL